MEECLISENLSTLLCRLCPVCSVLIIFTVKDVKVERFIFGDRFVKFN